MSLSCPRSLAPADLDAVVEVHRAAFPGFLMTLLGPEFLRSYYQTVLDCEYSIFLGQFDEAQELKGFVAGFTRPAVFYAMLAKRKRRMLVAAAFHLAMRPMLWRRVLENSGTTSRRASADGDATAELASIAVSPGMQGRGYGTSLIQAFLGAASKAGVWRVDLTTDSDGNDAVNRLYRKAGFRLQTTFTRAGGRQMNHYTIDVTKVPAAFQQGEV